MSESSSEFRPPTDETNAPTERQEAIFSRLLSTSRSESQSVRSADTLKDLRQQLISQGANSCYDFAEGLRQALERSGIDASILIRQDSGGFDTHGAVQLPDGTIIDLDPAGNLSDLIAQGDRDVARQIARSPHLLIAEPGTEVHDALTKGRFVTVHPSDSAAWSDHYMDLKPTFGSHVDSEVLRSDFLDNPASEDSSGVSQRDVDGGVQRQSTEDGRQAQEVAGEQAERQRVVDEPESQIRSEGGQGRGAESPLNADDSQSQSSTGGGGSGDGEPPSQRPDESSTSRQEQLDKGGSQKKTTVTISDSAGRIVGQAKVAPDRKHPGFSYISGLEITEEARGQGHGDSLIEAAVKESGGRARLEVEAGNDAARSLYAKHGFRVVEEVVGSDGTSYLRMELDRSSGQQERGGGPRIQEVVGSEEPPGEPRQQDLQGVTTATETPPSPIGESMQPAAELHSTKINKNPPLTPEIPPSAGAPSLSKMESDVLRLSQDRGIRLGASELGITPQVFERILARAQGKQEAINEASRAEEQEVGGGASGGEVARQGLRADPEIIEIGGQRYDTGAFTVLQKGFGVIGINSEIQRIGTGELGPCIGVKIYDPENRVLGVIHVDATTDLEATIGQVLNTMAQAGTTSVDLQVEMMGGTEATIGERQQLRDIFQARNINNVIDLGQDHSSFVASVQDGKSEVDVAPGMGVTTERVREEAERKLSTELTPAIPELISIGLSDSSVKRSEGQAFDMFAGPPPEGFTSLETTPSVPQGVTERGVRIEQNQLGNTTVTVANESGVLVGEIILGEGGNKEAHIGNVMVDDGEKGKGQGKDLQREFIATAQEQGAERLTGTIVHPNALAGRERLGGGATTYYRRNDDGTRTEITYDDAVDILTNGRRVEYEALRSQGRQADADALLADPDMRPGVIAETDLTMLPRYERQYPDQAIDRSSGRESTSSEPQPFPQSSANGSGEGSRVDLGGDEARKVNLTPEQREQFANAHRVQFEDPLPQELLDAIRESAKTLEGKDPGTFTYEELLLWDLANRGGAVIIDDLPDSIRRSLRYTDDPDLQEARRMQTENAARTSRITALQTTINAIMHDPQATVEPFASNHGISNLPPAERAHISMELRVEAARILAEKGRLGELDKSIFDRVKVPSTSEIQYTLSQAGLSSAENPPLRDESVFGPVRVDGSDKNTPEYTSSQIQTADVILHLEGDEIERDHLETLRLALESGQPIINPDGSLNLSEVRRYMRDNGFHDFVVDQDVQDRIGVHVDAAVKRQEEAFKHILDELLRSTEQRESARSTQEDQVPHVESNEATIRRVEEQVSRVKAQYTEQGTLPANIASLDAVMDEVRANPAIFESYDEKLIEHRLRQIANGLRSGLVDNEEESGSPERARQILAYYDQIDADRQAKLEEEAKRANIDKMMEQDSEFIQMLKDHFFNRDSSLSDQATAAMELHKLVVNSVEDIKRSYYQDIDAEGGVWDWIYRMSHYDFRRFVNFARSSGHDIPADAAYRRTASGSYEPDVVESMLHWYDNLGDKGRYLEGRCRWYGNFERYIPQLRRDGLGEVADQIESGPFETRSGSRRGLEDQIASMAEQIRIPLEKKRFERWYKQLDTRERALYNLNKARKAAAEGLSEVIGQVAMGLWGIPGEVSSSVKQAVRQVSQSRKEWRLQQDEIYRLADELGMDAGREILGRGVTAEQEQQAFEDHYNAMPHDQRLALDQALKRQSRGRETSEDRLLLSQAYAEALSRQEYIKRFNSDPEFAQSETSRLQEEFAKVQRHNSPAARFGRAVAAERLLRMGLSDLAERLKSGEEVPKEEIRQRVKDERLRREQEYYLAKERQSVAKDLKREFADLPESYRSSIIDQVKEGMDPEVARERLEELKSEWQEFSRRLSTAAVIRENWLELGITPSDSKRIANAMMRGKDPISVEDAYGLVARARASVEFFGEKEAIFGLAKEFQKKHGADTRYNKVYDILNHNEWRTPEQAVELLDWARRELNDIAVQQELDFHNRQYRQQIGLSTDQEEDGVQQEDQWDQASNQSVEAIPSAPAGARPSIPSKVLLGLGTLFSKQAEVQNQDTLPGELDTEYSAVDSVVSVAPERPSPPAQPQETPRPHIEDYYETPTSRVVEPAEPHQPIRESAVRHIPTVDVSAPSNLVEDAYANASAAVRAQIDQLRAERARAYDRGSRRPSTTGSTHEQPPSPDSVRAGPAYSEGMFGGTPDSMFAEGSRAVKILRNFTDGSSSDQATPPSTTQESSSPAEPHQLPQQDQQRPIQPPVGDGSKIPRR